MRLLSALRDFFQFIKKWFWAKPVTPEPEDKFRLKAQELNLKNAYTVIEYKGQRINLNKQQLEAFHKMNRNAKRRVLEYWKNMEKKGHVKFVTINDQLVAVKNKDYESKADIRQSHSNKTGSGE